MNRRLLVAALALPLALTACSGGEDGPDPDASYPAPPASSVVTVGDPTWSARDLELVDASDTAVLVASTEPYPDDSAVYHRLVARSPADGEALLTLDDRYPDDLDSRTEHDVPLVLEAVAGDRAGDPVVMPFQRVACDVPLGRCPTDDKTFTRGVLAVGDGGTEAWRWLPPGASRGSADEVRPVAVLDGTVVVRTGPRGSTYRFGAVPRATTWGLDAESGAVLWRHRGLLSPVGDALTGVEGRGAAAQEALVVEPGTGRTTWRGGPGTEVVSAAGPWLMVTTRAAAEAGGAQTEAESVTTVVDSRDVDGGPAAVLPQALATAAPTSSAVPLLAWTGPADPDDAFGEQLLWTVGPDDDRPTAVPFPALDGAEEPTSLTSSAGDHVVLADARRSWIVGRDGTVQSEPLDGSVEHLGPDAVLTAAGERVGRTLRPLDYS